MANKEEKVEAKISKIVAFLKKEFPGCYKCIEQCIEGGDSCCSTDK